MILWLLLIYDPPPFVEKEDDVYSGVALLGCGNAKCKLATVLHHYTFVEYRSKKNTKRVL